MIETEPMVVARRRSRIAKLLVVALSAGLPLAIASSASALQADGGYQATQSQPWPADDGQSSGYFIWNCRQMGGTAYEYWGYVVCYQDGYTIICSTRGGVTHSCRFYASYSTKPSAGTRNSVSSQTMASRR